MVHQVVRAGRRLLALAAVAALAGFAPPVAAQTGSVSGTILDSKTGRPLADARVLVEGTNLSARSGTRGEFRIAGVSGAAVHLSVTRIGYQPKALDATVDGQPLRIELDELVVKLDELVVTGTAGEAQKRTLGNAIGQVDVASTLAIAGPPAKIQDLLSVNVPGVRIVRSSGSVGTGGVTRIRGAGSLSLSNEPLIYVDGVRVNNTAAVNSVAFQGYDSPSRVNDLNPEEIESIEVLKGPSAATIYGTEASNGVIQIITKRGRAGRPTFDVHLEGGANWIANPEGRYPSNYYIARDGSVQEFNVLKFNEANGFGSPFRTGKPVTVGASLSGGSDQLRYYFSTDFNRDEGPVTYNWQDKFSGRANVTYSTPDSKFKVDLSMGAVRSKTQASGYQPITTSILWACNFPGCEPSASDPTHTGYNDAGHGYQFYRPEDYAEAAAFDNVDRTTFSLQFSHRPFNWLRQRLTIGPDFVNNKSTHLVDRHADARRPFFTASNGLREAMQNRSTFVTVDYGASADATLVGGKLVATTSAGAQYYYKQFDTVYGSGSNFAIPGPADISGGSTITAQETFLENKNFGVYGQEQLAWKNRVFLTGALRADDNSAFGANFNAVYYPKVSFSWVASDEPFLAGSKFLSQLKFRGAWGRAGLQPDVFFAIQTYAPKIGTGGQGGVTPQNLGNPDLKPEVGEEVEVGFDAGFFNGRAGIEFTFYNKDTKDAILSLPLKPSRGFPGSQFVNIGKVRNKGIEIALDGTPVNKRSWGLDLRGTFATNDVTILDMGGTPPAFVGGSFIQQFNVQGFAPASFFYKTVVSSTVQPIDIGVPLPVGFDPMCEGGTDLGAGDGSVVPCADAPRIYRGRPTPKWNGSFSAQLRIGQRLRLLGLVDYVGGHTVDVGDVGAIHAFFLSSKQVLEGKDQVLAGYMGLQFLYGDANPPGSLGLFNAGFAKLRTVSATYDVPDGIAHWLGATRGSITLAAENMVTLWRAQKTSYGVEWIDAEIAPNYSTNAQGLDGYIQESWPQLARIRTTIRFTF